ncbi:MAG: hypothetical protein K0R49_1523 [Burkholderiales bacterium]|jgi:hypothetical protein|nr:hypothetical protein [Burkholderiales bacterium]
MQQFVPQDIDIEFIVKQGAGYLYDFTSLQHLT